MELIFSLIVLAVLVIPPVYLAGREMLTFVTTVCSGQVHSHKAVEDSAESTVADPANVYDGMITVEIPVSSPQVVAYEPPPNVDADIEIIRHISRA